MLPVAAAAAVDSAPLGIGGVIDLRPTVEPRSQVPELRGWVDASLDDQVGGAGLNPSWLRVAFTWHEAGRLPGPIVADLLLATAALLLVGTTPRGTALGAAVLLVSGLLFGLWKRRLPYETQGVLWYVGHLAPAATAVGFALAVGDAQLTTHRVAAASIAMSLALIAARAALWLVIGSARRRGQGLQEALIVGPPRRIEQVRHRLDTYPEAGLRFRAGYTPEPTFESSEDYGRKVVGSLLSDERVDHVICVPEEVEENVFLDFVRFSDGQVDVSLVLPVATLCAGKVRSSIGDLGVLPLRLRPAWGSDLAKRVVDVVGAACLLALLSPVFLLVTLAIRLGDNGPALFRQPRVGRDGRVFTILKFRSMVVGADLLQGDYVTQNVVKRGLLFKLDRDPRVTAVGSVIRRFSIDELPQLVNVVRGDMSLVGPRPLA
ncbi:MAG TPA: sugar transferase, partial [Acidimicrobiales bacterium]|nr:sugar transferase [Acidimicrobiales bacterium]